MTGPREKATKDKPKPLGVWRPIVNTDWAATLAERAQKTFGPDLKVYQDEFRLQMLRQAEIRSVIEAGEVALSGLKGALKVREQHTSSKGLTVGVEKLLVPEHIGESGQLIIFKIVPGKSLKEERESMGRAVKTETGLDIRNAAAFYWDFVVGVGEQAAGISEDDVFNCFQGAIPLTVDLAPSVTNLELEI